MNANKMLIQLISLHNNSCRIFFMTLQNDRMQPEGLTVNSSPSQLVHMLTYPRHWPYALALKTTLILTLTVALIQTLTSWFGDELTTTHKQKSSHVNSSPKQTWCLGILWVKFHRLKFSGPAQAKP